MKATERKRPLDTSNSVIGNDQNGCPVTQRAVPRGTSKGSGQTANTITDAIVAEQSHDDRLPPLPPPKKQRSSAIQQLGGQTGSALSTAEAIGATTSTTRAAGHVTSVHPYLPPAQGNAPHVTPSLGRGPATAHGLGTQPMVIDLRHADVVENGNADDDIPAGSGDGIELEPWRPVALKAHNCPNYDRNSAINYIKAILDRLPPGKFTDAQGKTHVIDKQQLILEPGDREYEGNQRSVSIRMRAAGHARGEFDEQCLMAIMQVLNEVGVPTLWSSCAGNDRSTIVNYTMIAPEGAKVDDKIADKIVRKAMAQTGAVPGNVWGSRYRGTAWGTSALQWIGSASDYDPMRCLNLIAKGPIMCDGYQITFSPASHFVRPTSCSTMAIYAGNDDGFYDNDCKAFARKMARTYTEWSRQSKDPSMAPYRDRKSLLGNYRRYGFWLVADASHFHFAHWLSKQDTPMGSRWTLVYHLNGTRNGYNCNVARRSKNTPTTSSRGRTQTKVINDNISKLAGKTINLPTDPAQISPTLNLSDQTNRPGRRRERMPATDLSGAYPSPTSPPSTQDEDTPRRA